jgi:hypothetical protein
MYLRILYNVKYQIEVEDVIYDILQRKENILKLKKILLYMKKGHFLCIGPI